MAVHSTSCSSLSVSVINPPSVNIDVFNLLKDSDGTLLKLDKIKKLHKNNLLTVD